MDRSAQQGLGVRVAVGRTGWSEARGQRPELPPVPWAASLGGGEAGGGFHLTLSAWPELRGQLGANLLRDPKQKSCKLTLGSPS